VYKGERFNSISHLIASVAALAGTACLIVVAAQQGDPWKIVSFSIYLLSQNSVGLRLLHAIDTS
jgi:hemolysin III